MLQTSIRPVRRFVVLSLVLVTAVALAGGCRTKKSGLTGQVPSVAPVSLLQQVQGDEPTIRNPQALIIQSQDELTKLNAPKLAALKVDFAKQTLVVLSLGRQATDGYWVKINGLQEEGDSLYIQATANKPGVDAKVERKASYPFAAVIVAKVKATKAILEVESVMGQPAATK